MTCVCLCGRRQAALAADFVWTHRNVILNPHYKSMGLYGSEYWTYFLPKRVGSAMASYLTESMLVRHRGGEGRVIKCEP